ncbi:MAG: fibronectin type III domain-containing protein [Acidobacteria bacterium]|nr:fibronectin type III domain-containing protein [Acidobacteriota bacterium]
MRRRSDRLPLVCFVLSFLTCTFPLAFAPRATHERFDALARPEPGAVIGVAPVDAAALAAGDALRQEWERFAAGQGGRWQAWIDERSGLPALAFGRGIAWVAGPGNDLPTGQPVTMQQLEALARAFVAAHPGIAGNVADQLQLDIAASGPAGDNLLLLGFRQVVDGVPVLGARYDFHVSAGNLVAFGATRFGAVRTATVPSLTSADARAALDAYLLDTAGLVEIEAPALVLLPLDADATHGAAWRGARGEGYSHLLVWRFVLAAADESPTWVAEVDAANGEVVALFDDTRYSRVKGGVYPLSNDGLGPEGTEQPGFPLPYADVGTQTANDAGVFTCGGTGNQTTTLAGPYIRVSDKCGAISQSAPCPRDIDLGQSGGTDCTVPPGTSPGNTHAARSSFYHLNRVMEKGRAWLPANTWLASQVVDNVNISATCNAFWNGSVNFYRSGGGCRNTGELQGVFVHEWGHGLDANDGGGYDNPSEAYADVVAFFESRESCVGRGFFMNGNCSGYGDACLDCTGIRDQDFAKHARQLPATPTNFLQTHCGGGDGPCGRETHCEAYVSAEAVWDLATRDLPAAGLDPASAWQLAERLFYLSRSGSGGNAYNCALPNSDGCGTNSWFHKFRLQDDDNGNLADGTPHAEAIYAAFARHGIACGLASDPSNQDDVNCLPLTQPVVTASASSSQVRLDWKAVPGTSKYVVLRNDTGCGRGQTIVGEVAAPGTTYTDTVLASGVTVHYRVQAQGSNAACAGPVSDCVAVATPAAAGTLSLDREAYACATAVTARVLDGNVAAPSVAARAWSGTESQPETLALGETASGSGVFVGSIATTTAPPVHGDGLLSVAAGDALTVEYLDADDGEGGIDVPRRDAAVVDCAPPQLGNVRATDITDTSAVIAWETDEIADGVVNWGSLRPPQATASGPATTTHRVLLSGLAPCSLYFFGVRSADGAGNATVADNAGEFFQFQTLGDFGSGPEVCHLGSVLIEQAAPACTATLSFGATDADLDRDPSAIETVVLRVSSSSETAPESVVVTETSASSLRFTGAIALAPGSPVADGRLQVSDGDVVTVAYHDDDDGHGGSGWRTATVRTDCRGPAIANLRVTSLTAARATVRFETDEPGDTVVEWGTSPALGQAAFDAAPATSHAVMLNQFDTCQPVYFRVRSTDAAGNQAVADDHGTPFALRTSTIPGLYWRENFESGASGWNLQGEWEVGEPRGLGGSEFGFPDPSAAYNNARILGHDLTGRGTRPGDYEPNSPEKAASPTLNASSWRATKLLVHRQLNAAFGDEASMYICAGSCGAVFRTGSQALSESGYGIFPYDVASMVDGKASVRLEFRQNSPYGAASGWNVDEVIFKDSRLPDYAACGGCGQAPAFAGATRARDEAACAPGGVNVTWAPAVAWGTGAAGSYAVYRGPAPGFPADAAHRVASGIAGLAYTDALAPAGTLYYLVRAENNETCGGGPANGGLTDANTAYVPVEETSSRPVPPEVVPVSAALVNHAHLRLDWTPAAAATSYRVYRSASPQPAGFALLATTAATAFEDLDQAGDPASRFYLVRAVNACGAEGP